MQDGEELTTVDRFSYLVSYVMIEEESCNEKAAMEIIFLNKRDLFFIQCLIVFGFFRSHFQSQHRKRLACLSILSFIH